jgi:hypothetical protein
MLFTCGRMITQADEDAIKMVPAGAWKPGIAQDGSTEQDKAVAEITHLMSRSGNWPEGLRWIVRRVKPSRRQMRNLTAYEKKTGWRYSIICTNIPGSGIGSVPGSHHPQYIDVLHREHACVETGGVRTAKAMGLRALPSKSWQVNCGWVIAANIAADLAAWTRLLGCHDDEDLRDADPDSLRCRQCGKRQPTHAHECGKPSGESARHHGEGQRMTVTESVGQWRRHEDCVCGRGTRWLVLRPADEAPRPRARHHGLRAEYGRFDLRLGGNVWRRPAGQAVPR